MESKLNYDEYGDTKTNMNNNRFYSTFREGDRIEGRYRGGGRWFKGEISRDNRDGTYDIRYDDGDFEYFVKAELIRKIGNSGNNSSNGGSTSFREGDKIEARYHGGARWFKGEISRDNRDGTYDVRYDDGDRESGVKSEYIRKIGDGNSSSLREGDKIEARYNGGAKWFKGEIKKDNGNGTYDIRYDDGNRENKVKIECIRWIVYIEGDKIEARYHGGTQWFKGEIVGKNSDGTYSIQYYGDCESGVKTDLIRKLGGEDSFSFREGDRIEARYNGGDQWFKGEISHDNRDGTYDIRYNDGDKESYVKSNYIRKSYLKGDKIEARYNGEDKWFKGEIIDGNNDGTYNIQYYGDFESDVKAEHIRKSYSKGDKIEARYRGRGRYYRGEITQKNSDETYDIKYNDGNKESKVKAEFIRKIDGLKLKKIIKYFELKVEKIKRYESDGRNEEEVNDILRNEIKTIMYYIFIYFV